ncbi:MAG: PIN domain-containing protein [Candidatus Dormibacteria bacterium]
MRAVSAGGPPALEQARRQLSRLDQVLLSTELLDRAATLAPNLLLRSLDAIHLAAAQVIGEELRAVITYDRRMAEAAGVLDLVVETPG